MVELQKIKYRGIIYRTESNEEIGSIVIRSTHIAFIAGNWCKQISRTTSKAEVEAIARKHSARINQIIANH